MVLFAIAYYFWPHRMGKARTLPSVKKGDIVEVIFFDHVDSDKQAKAIRFHVYGRVICSDQRSIVVGSWVYPSTRRKCDHNTNTYTIIRSCIEDIRKLEYAGRRSRRHYRDREAQ